MLSSSLILLFSTALVHAAQQPLTGFEDDGQSLIITEYQCTERKTVVTSLEDLSESAQHFWFLKNINHMLSGPLAVPGDQVCMDIDILEAIKVPYDDE